MLQWTWDGLGVGVVVVVQISLWHSDFIFFRYIPRRGIAGSYDSSVFNYLRNLCAVSIMAVPIYSPTNRTQVFLFIHCLWQHLLSLVFFFFFFFVFFFFGYTHGIWKFPGQGLNLNQRYDLCHSCSNTGSLSHCDGLGSNWCLHRDKPGH